MEYIETINAVSATEVGQKTKVLTCIKILSWLSSWEQIPVDASYSRFYSHNINQSISSVGTDCFGSLPIYMSITLRIKIWKEDKCDYLSSVSCMKGQRVELSQEWLADICCEAICFGSAFGQVLLGSPSLPVSLMRGPRESKLWARLSLSFSLTQKDELHDCIGNGYSLVQLVISQVIITYNENLCST